MPIEFNCPNCQKFLRTSDEKAGRQAKCPECGQTIVVPQETVGTESFVEETPDGPQHADGFETSPELPSMEFSAVKDLAAQLQPNYTSGPTKSCPMCGEAVKREATKCRFCGETLAASGPPMVAPRSPSTFVKPHRAGMILTFGILSWFLCPIFGILAWIFGAADMAEMKVGVMDPEGLSTTQAGKIVGMIHVIIVASVVLLYCGAFIIFGVLAGI